MPRFLVVGIVDAQVSVEVEADDVDSAVDVGIKALPGANVCHQCSNKLEVGETYRIQVISDGGSGDIVYDDDPDIDKRKLRRAIDIASKHLARATAALKRAESEVTT